ncbi:FCD domain-containing protein [Roseibium aggregatum]|uniref:FCD domain-containing protein n=1 Tax=Roseibium aggregatum TaxID=187304 RepID=A0A939J4X3_9HYPH|nr:FCD domain-containing protein [Roseibium aggregatum]MBN9672072.1 FCD domain-containing protein [Roseibium aggregatum]
MTGVLERELQNLILTGNLKPGQKLNEIKLSERFGVSRGPLREATRALAARGLVDFFPNRGVFVRSIPFDEALEIYDVRAAVFGLAGRLLVDLVTDDMLTKLYGFVDTMDALARDKHFESYYPVNLEFHQFLIGSTRHKTLQTEYNHLVNKLHLCRAKALVQPGSLALSNREHREMVDSLASGDKLRSQEAFFRHVERAKRRLQAALKETENASFGAE